MVDCKICEHTNCTYAGEQRGFVIGCTNYMPKQKPQTNADRIRAMSDEELMLFLATKPLCPRIKGECPCDCTICWNRWLKQPVKDGDNDG
jgi:hypothetical protein